VEEGMLTQNASLIAVESMVGSPAQPSFRAYAAAKGMVARHYRRAA
jgi:hypothetical protein